jgi:hypothetical protein
MPTWLGSLVARWHEDRASVITLNYDTLVEAAYTQVVTVGHPSHGSPTYESAYQLYRGAFTPVGMRHAAVFGTSMIDTMTLLKLHGSRAWLYSGRESFFGETIYDCSPQPGWELRPSIIESWLIEDKVPLIVPPTAGKSSFFNNETVQYQWKLAHQALTSAHHIYVVGYSVPLTDSLFRFLLQSSCSGSGCGCCCRIVRFEKTWQAALLLLKVWLACYLL